MANEEPSGAACPSCKKHNPSNAAFCMACGATIAPLASSPVPSGARRVASAIGNAVSIAVLQLRSFLDRCILFVVDWKAGKNCSPATNAEHEIHAGLTNLIQRLVALDLWPPNMTVAGKIKCLAMRAPFKAFVWAKAQFLYIQLGKTVRETSIESKGALIQEKLKAWNAKRSSLATATPWLLRQPLLVLLLLVSSSAILVKRTPTIARVTAKDSEISPATQRLMDKWKAESRETNRERERKVARFKKFQDGVLLFGPNQTTRYFEEHLGLHFQRTDAVGDYETQYFRNDQFDVSCFFNRGNLTQISVGATGRNKIIDMANGIRSCDLAGAINLSGDEWERVKSELQRLIEAGGPRTFPLGEREGKLTIMPAQNLINFNTDTVAFSIKWPE